MKTAKKQLSSPHKLDESLLRVITLQVLDSLGNAGLIESALEDFLARYPQYEVHRAGLKSECEVSCAGCAIMASYIGACRTAGDTVMTGDLNWFMKQCAGFQKYRTRALRAVEQSRLTQVESYVEIFLYIYDKCGRKFEESGCAMSALSSMAFCAATHALGRNYLNDFMHQEIHHVLHECIMPLLESTFQIFGGSGTKTAASQYSAKDIDVRLPLRSKNRRAV